MSHPATPRARASRLTTLLNAALPPERRFPVAVASLARDYSAQIYPADPIREVEGRSLPGFEGALIPIRSARGGWGIAYNKDIRSPGRIRWTLGHELGHYLTHRRSHPDGISCSQKDVADGAGSGQDIEREADQFAADLLMPFDDFRCQIGAREAADLAALSDLAENRYGVSLMAISHRWLDYTERRAVFVVSRDGFMLWARSSPAAYRTGAVFPSRKRTVPVPDLSLAARQDMSFDNRAGVTHPPGVWFDREPAREMTVFSEHYDLIMSLLLLEDSDQRW